MVLRRVPARTPDRLRTILDRGRYGREHGTLPHSAGHRPSDVCDSGWERYPSSSGVEPGRPSPTEPARPGRGTQNSRLEVSTES